MRRAALALLVFWALPALAVQPGEILPDAALEARARAISATLRCPVCQGENIDESNAPVARDLRLAVRERLTAGDSDAEVVAFVTDRFGEFVLFDPPKRGANLILWLAGPGMLLIGLTIAWTTLRRRPGTAAETLSPEERSRLEGLLKDGQ
ncbi:MAG: cytochrome c-type biogenesis protein CcmH [Paracoccaceae bacterium]